MSTPCPWEANLVQVLQKHWSRPFPVSPRRNATRGTCPGEAQAWAHPESGPAPHSPRLEQPEAMGAGMWPVHRQNTTQGRKAHEATTGSSRDKTHKHRHKSTHVIPFVPSFRANKTKLCCFRDICTGVTMLKIKAVTVTKSEWRCPPLQGFST